MASIGQGSNLFQIPWFEVDRGSGYRLPGEIMYFALDEDQVGNFVVAWDKAGEQMDSGLSSFGKPTFCN